jgi:hypothetical protein
MARAIVARRIDFAPAVVWEALVDPDLVSGWLHPEATFLPRDGGDVELLEEPSELVAETALFGRVEIRVAPAPGLARAVATDLLICAGPEVDPPFLPALVAVWAQRLDRLDDLLRGHPADWASVDDRPPSGTEAPPTA